MSSPNTIITGDVAGDVMEAGGLPLFEEAPPDPADLVRRLMDPETPDTAYTEGEVSLMRTHLAALLHSSPQLEQYLKNCSPPELIDVARARLTHMAHRNTNVDVAQAA